ncbi:MAG: 50S ribosomal protein L10 [Armatimonadota bacterium]
MPKQRNIDQVAELKQDLERSKALLLTDYRGLRVSEISDLRRKLRAMGASYKVVKNTLFELASGNEEVFPMLTGPTAIAFVGNDPVASAKALVDFAREHKALELKGGVVEGRVLGAEQIQALSKVPPRDVLIAQMVGSIQSPLSNLVGTLQGVMSGLVYTLQAVAAEKAA